VGARHVPHSPSPGGFSFFSFLPVRGGGGGFWMAIFLIGIYRLVRNVRSLQTPQIISVTSDNYSIHVSHKAGAHPSKVPVLLIPRKWGMPRPGFSGSSVMAYLAVRGYDLSSSISWHGQNLYQGQRTRGLFPIDILGVRDAAAVAG